MHSYKTNDPRGWCGDPGRGAALGRPAIAPAGDYAGRLAIQRVKMLDDAYDTNGTYWGRGLPLYWIFDPDEGVVDVVIRAHSRAAAIAVARTKFPHARIRRTRHDHT